jgi:hypothetical protein
VSRYRTTRGWGWNHNKKPIDLSKHLTVCAACGRINPHVPPDPASYRTAGGFVDPIAYNTWTKPVTCAGCGGLLP